MPYMLLEFRGKQGNSPRPSVRVGGGWGGSSREKRQLAAFRFKNNFVGPASGYQKRPLFAWMTLGIYDSQVSRAPRSSELFVQEQVLVLSPQSRLCRAAPCRTRAPLTQSCGLSPVRLLISKAGCELTGTSASIDHPRALL